ncbi:MCM3 [Symbiodinium natans]|uniref:MCM3 protein n=1 Tax=Symbiodinium natans TaxID=878477 RepID=A0A812PBB2_9DINO|nr:MCM3 [Symbiodinium natans]
MTHRGPKWVNHMLPLQSICIHLVDFNSTEDVFEHRCKREMAKALVLKRCAPYMILICLASFFCGFTALLFMPECWRAVIELDYLAMACNVIGASFLYRHLLSGGGALKVADWQLALAFYLPWAFATFLQIATFSCGAEARDGYYSTRVVYFCYRALLSIALMCPWQCAIGELVCSGLVAFDVQSSDARAVMMTIELVFLYLVFTGVCFFGQQLIEWGFDNAAKAEEALSALVEARQGLIEKLCDAEVELSGDFRMLESSSSWSDFVGISPANFDGTFLDVVADDDRERVLNFLLNSSQDGSNSCIQATLNGANDFIDVRIYHAAQSGRSDACRHRLAVLNLTNIEPALAKTMSGSEAEASEPLRFGSDCDDIFHPMNNMPATVRGADISESEMDTLICSESVTGRSQSQVTDNATLRSRSTLTHRARLTSKFTRTQGTQTDAHCTHHQTVASSDVACQTVGIARPPAMRETGNTGSLPRERSRSDRKARTHRKLAFTGEVVKKRKLILASTCQLLMLEAAKRMNVRGVGCCAYHVIMAYIFKSLKSMMASECRELAFNSDWQCAVCHALHSFEEDDQDMDGKYWCDVCGSTEAPAPSDTDPPSSRADEAMSDGPPSSLASDMPPEEEPSEPSNFLS